MSAALTERQEREMQALCRIAKVNGAALTLRELITLAAIDTSEEDLATAFQADSKLSSKFVLESGYVLERQAAPHEGSARLVEEVERKKQRALSNLEAAGRFAAMIARGTAVVSVSGANSYFSAREGDDIDFFCVTRTNGLWPFMLRALAIARIHRLANPGVPVLCFSCTMDGETAAREFGKRHDPIFARDALMAKVIRGTAEYHALLEKARWMEGCFPAFYAVRLRETSQATPRRRPETGERGSFVFNSFLYHSLGSFLRIKSWALNRKLAKAERGSSLFETKINKGYYLYESNRYRELRKMYDEMERETSSNRRGP
jgi:hypothetical protein